MSYLHIELEDMMLVERLLVWLNMPDWLIWVNTTLGYATDGAFALFFVVFALYSYSAENSSDRKDNAKGAVAMLLLELSSLVAGLLGPITLCLGYLIWYSVREAFYDPNQKKWNLDLK